MLLLFVQALNGLQFGVMLFLMAAGLTLVFGIMNVVNLAHGSLYMIGAYVCAETYDATGSFASGRSLRPRRRTDHRHRYRGRHFPHPSIRATISIRYWPPSA